MRFPTFLLSLMFAVGCPIDTSAHEDLPLETSSEYPGDSVPGPIPELFAPGDVSLPNRSEFGSVFSPDGKAFYYGVDHQGWCDIRVKKRLAEGWTESSVVVGSPKFSANDPFLSNDGTKLYFISNSRGHYDIGYVERMDGERWSEPKFPGAPINSQNDEYYISFTQAGDLVFASDRAAKTPGDFDIYVSRLEDGGYRSAEVFPETVNSQGYEADAFIAPDESYLIFSTRRRGGLGRGDLFISFADGDGGWTEAVSMGCTINTDGHELCPFVTADGRFLFYTSRQDIYWVDAAIIENLR